MNIILRSLPEEAVKVPILWESRKISKIPVKIPPEKKEEEWWFLGSFRPLCLSQTSGQCADPEHCSWLLGPCRCAYH